MEGPKIFVVDDDPILLDFIKTILSEYAYDVTTFTSSEECYRALDEVKPDILLVDQVLPGSDGSSLLEIVKRKLPLAWRLLMTGQRVDDDFVKDAVNRAGVHYFLQKPFGAQELLFTIKKAIEDRRCHIQLQHLLDDLDRYARQKAKEALSFHRRYQALFDRLDLGVFVTDWVGNILEINPFGRKLLGLLVEGPVRYSIRSLFPTSHVFDNILRLLEKKGEVRGLETVLIPLKTPSKEVPVSITAFPFEDPDSGRLILGIMEDLRRDVELKAMLLEAQIQLRATIDAMKDIIFTVNDKLEVISWNKAFMDFLGGNFMDLKGKRCFEVLEKVSGFCCDVGASHDGLCPILKRVFENGQEERRSLFLEEKDGSYWEHWVYPIPDVSGHIKQAVIVFRDVTETERKRREIKRMNCELSRLYHEAQEKNREFERLIQELKEAQAHLIQSEKMASIGQLSAGIAHEINNPVGFINSNLNTLRDYVQDIKTFVEDVDEGLNKIESICNKQPNILSVISELRESKDESDLEFILEDIEELIEQSLEGTQRVRQIVQDLKEFSHGGKKELEYVDLNKCLDSTLNIVWNELKYKAEVKKDYGDLPLLPCYPQKLNQVFMNLLVNAAQAIEDRGEIRIITRCVKSPRDGVEVLIEDTGKGMTEDVIKKIFEPFFTTKPVGKGTGLGLHVSYKIVKAHKGDIKVSSMPEKGTTFTVFLPILTEDEFPKAEEA